MLSGRVSATGGGHRWTKPQARNGIQEETHFGVLGRGGSCREVAEEQGPGLPEAMSALLRDGITPHGEAHAHDGAGDEDQEDHKGTDQEVQEGVEEGAAARPREGC